MAEDVRRRRAERVRQDRAKRLLEQNRKYLLPLVAILAIIVVVVAFPNIIPKGAPPERFAHEHPAFSIFIHGQHVSFDDSAYDINQISDKVHMHIGRGPAAAATWHVEANFPNGIPDIPIARIFEQYGLTFRQGYLRLDTHDGHNGSEWPDSGTNVWQVWVSKMVVNATTTENERQPFEQVTGDYSRYVPRDLDKILITYGTPTPQELARQQSLVPEPQP